MEKRNTIQKKLVLDAVRKLGCHSTAEEIYAEVSSVHPTISKGTVYRNLNVLADEGEIRKIEMPDSAARYDHTNTGHYHIKCLKCGRVYDVDMEIIPDITGFINDTHGFDFLDHDILFKGICPDCK